MAISFNVISRKANLNKLHEVMPYGVFIDVNPAPGLFDSVQPDLQQTMYDAVGACAKAGMTRVGFIGGKGAMTNFYEVDEEGRAVYFRREMGTLWSGPARAGVFRRLVHRGEWPQAGGAVHP